jgi:hypothetical protein
VSFLGLLQIVYRLRYVVLYQIHSDNEGHQPVAFVWGSLLGQSYSLRTTGFVYQVDRLRLGSRRVVSPLESFSAVSIVVLTSAHSHSVDTSRLCELIAVGVF